MRTLLPTFAAIAALFLAFAVSPALAEEVKYHADLTGQAAIPPNDSKGTGMLDATYDTDGKMLTWTVTYQDLSGDVTAAHFHGPAEAGKAADPVVPIPEPYASPIKGSATLTDEQYGDLSKGLMVRQPAHREVPRWRNSGTGRSREVAASGHRVAQKGPLAAALLRAERRQQSPREPRRLAVADGRHDDPRRRDQLVAARNPLIQHQPRAGNFGNRRLHTEQIVDMRRSHEIHSHRADGERNAILRQLRMMHAFGAQELRPPAFEEMQVRGVIDGAREVGVLVVHPNIDPMRLAHRGCTRWRRPRAGCASTGMSGAGLNW